MSIFTPGRRWQPPFYPFKKEKLSRRLLAGIERIVKGALFGCRMCGNCLLQETAFICPMECPKGLRNGPCGGSTSEYCYVDKTRPCVWYAIYDRSFRMNREAKLMEVLPPLDWNKAGTETWGAVVRQARIAGTGRFLKGMLSRDKAKRHETWENVFHPIRQPDWWQGDSEYHPPACSGPISELERRLINGEFVFTVEIIPPLGANASPVKKSVETVKPYATAVNFTDNPSATPRMTAMTCCKVASDSGIDSVLQITARDHNRYSLQSKVLGAAELGIKNILCITGDNPAIGPLPQGSMEIFDLDSVQMLWILRKMRDEGIYLDGRVIKNKPSFFLGAAASPFASKPEFQAIREHKKINAGAQFLQTNLVFDPAGMEKWLEQLYKRNVLDKVYILVGIAVLKSLNMTLHLKNEIPGVVVPDEIVKRVEKAGESAQEEGVVIALELIGKISRLQGVHGIHLTTMGNEHLVERIVKESGKGAKTQK
ncbi:MAG: methylenetetrahydrofolate reductase C-terminal domain-containing protein [Bacteroidales bacterium]